MSKVTIIIVGYKRPDVLLRTFSSVQTLGAVHVRRCIIIDNGGCADAAQMLDREHSWVTAITGNGNVGFGKGCNLGLIETVTPLALLLNPDATLTRSALDEMVKFMNEHEEAGIIAPAIQEEGGGLQQAGGLPDPIRIAVEQCCALAPTRQRKSIVPGAPPFPTDWVSGAIFMIRMKMVTEIGLFDPRFFLYFEETDFCKRALDCGWQIWAIGTAVGRHENGVSAKEERQDMYHGCIAEHYFKSRHYYLRKHYGWAIAKAVGICEFIATCLSYTGKRLFNRDRQRTAIRLHSTFLRTPKKRVVDV